MTCHQGQRLRSASSNGILFLPESRWKPMAVATVTSSPLMHKVSSESIFERER